MGAAGGRWLTRTPSIYNWDTIHYMLAQERYAILAHQPHPPGSYYYVLLARAARHLAGGPHAGLLLLSCLSGAALVVVLFLLARELAGEDAGWLAAVVGASAPLFWFYGSVGLNYAPAGTLAAVFALACVRLCRGIRPCASAILAGSALGLLGGFRPTDALFLTPAFLWAAACSRRHDRRAAGAGLAVSAALTLGWLAPNVLSAGTLAAYLQSIRDQEHLLQRSSVLAVGWPAWNEAVLTHQRTLESTLGAAWIPAILGLVYYLARRTSGADRAPEGHGAVRGAAASPSQPGLLILASLIVLPAFLFYLLGHFNSPGYALTYAGLLAAGGAAACTGFLKAVSTLRDRRGARAGTRRGVSSAPGPAAAANRTRRDLVALCGSVLTVNTVLFLAGWPGAGRLGQRSLSYAEIQDHHRYYQELRAFLAARHPRGTVRVLTSWTATDGLRVLQALLPEYEPDIAQAVHELPQLPSGLTKLTFMRLISLRRIHADKRPAYAVARTWDDPYYHESIFGRDFDQVRIGPRHVVYRIRPLP